MKCFCTGGLLFLLLLFSVHSQQGGGAPASPGRADIIVLLDNSGTMFPFFDTINTAVLEDITANFIRQGDTFHLITFNTTPAAEIVQQISSERDVRRIVSRFRLLYPLGVYSDFLSAIKFTQRYVNSLTTDTQKIVVIISDGILHPPETSPYYRLSPEETEAEIVSSVSRMHRDGTQIYFIKAPFPEGVKIRRLGTGDVPAPSSPDTPAGTEILPPAIPAPAAAPEATGSEAVQDEDDRAPDFFEYATTLEQSPAVVTDMLPDDGEEVPSFTENTLLLPEITFSEVLGKQFYTFRLPLGMINNTDRKLRFQLNGIIINSENVLEKTLFIDVPPRGTASFKPTVVIPDSWESGEQLLSAELVFADNVRVQPQQLHFSVTLTPGGGFAEWFRQSRFIFFALVMIAAAVLLISIVAVLLNRMLSGSHAHAIRAAHDALQETEKAAAAISGSFDSGQVLAGFREKAAGSRETADRSAVPSLGAVPSLRDGGGPETVSAETAPVSAGIQEETSPGSVLDSVKAGDAVGTESARTLGLFRKERAAPGSVLDSVKAGDAAGTESARTLDAFRKERAAPGSALDAVKAGDAAGTESARTLDAFRRERAAPGSALDSVKAGDAAGTESARTLDAFRRERSVSEGILDSVKTGDESRKAASALLLAGAGRPDNGEWKLPVIHKPDPRKQHTNRRPAVSPGKVGIRGQSSIMLELFVDRQNRNIGKRNIHILKPGSRMLVGGTKGSAFMVFLVRFPASLAEVRYDGVSCSLAILKPEYFPYETDRVIADCLNRDIILRSDKGYEVTFRLKNYENPAIQLNRLLLSLNE